jgi:hypothetical protein
MQSKYHLFEELLRFLAKSSFPDATPGGPVTTLVHQNLCIDALLYFLKTLVERRNANSEYPVRTKHFNFEPQVKQLLCNVSEQSLKQQILQISPYTIDVNYSDQEYSPSRLAQNRANKRILLEGTEIFNRSIKEGLAFFQGNRIPYHLKFEPSLMGIF